MHSFNRQGRAWRRLPIRQVCRGGHRPGTNRPPPGQFLHRPANWSPNSIPGGNRDYNRLPPRTHSHHVPLFGPTEPIPSPRTPDPDPTPVRRPGPSPRTHIAPALAAVAAPVPDLRSSSSTRSPLAGKAAAARQAPNPCTEPPTRPQPPSATPARAGSALPGPHLPLPQRDFCIVLLIYVKHRIYSSEGTSHDPTDFCHRG